MSSFFAFPTINSWDEDVFQLTTAGIITVIVLIAALIIFALISAKGKKSRKFTTSQLVISAACMALATVTSMISLIKMPMGGSATLLSMFFITFIGYMYGPRAGIMTGFAYGLLQFVLDPVFYTVPQMIVDYPLAFGALGLSGFFSGRKYGLQIGYVVAVLGRFVFAWLSGYIFFAAYADGTGMGPALYSFVYNGSYLAVEGIITLIIISIPAVSKAIAHVKSTCVNL